MRSSTGRLVPNHGTGVSELVLMLSKRVDDLKIAGREERVDRLIGRVKGVFGKMEGDYGYFANCGVRRRRSADGTVALDQDEYVDALVPIRHVDLIKAKADEPARGPLPDLFVPSWGHRRLRCSPSIASQRAPSPC